MKQAGYVLILTAVIAILSVGCGTVKNDIPISRGYLTENSICLDLGSLIRSAGIPDRDRAAFFDEVRQINKLPTTETLPKGFAVIEPLERASEGILSGETEDDSRRIFFSLTKETLLQMPEGADPVPEAPGARMQEPVNPNDPFQTFYGEVPIGQEEDPEELSRKWLEAWETSGIFFQENPNVSLITVVVPLETDEGYFLKAIQAGVLLPTPDGDLWYLEKPEGDLPFRIVKVQNRDQLHVYLRSQVPKEETLLIFENDRLLLK